MDSKHDGTCTAATAAAVCATGACNTTTSTCALANGTTCTAGHQCALNVCGANGKCGAADGDPGCTTADASVCQSGLCSATGNRCLPMGQGRCAIDADCAGTVALFCDGTTLTCVAKLTDGARLPNDGVHDGVCQPGTGTAICASGMCNARANTCAGVLGSACVSANTCANDMCGSNGKCGLADGEGTCAVSTQATDCQSGLCNAAAGLCQPQGTNRCVRDADCAAASYCDKSTLSCVAALAAGMPLPSDSGHDSTCSATVAAQLCASKQCNAVTNTCASPNATVCTAVSQCSSNVCGTDGKCGALDGVACGAVAACRSGQCTQGVCGAGLSSGTTTTVSPQAPTSLSGGGSCSCDTGGGAGSFGGAALALLLLGLTLVRRKGVR
jgi:MYXO-CTERM domain-containing protein